MRLTWGLEIPLWQLKHTAALVNAAKFPLLGLALLRLAAFLDPENPLQERRQRLCSRQAGHRDDVLGAVSGEFRRSIMDSPVPVIACSGQVGGADALD
jgi:hypothetical protein